jgi:hypothetical protein
MDLDHHAAREALALWVPELDRLIEGGYRGEALLEVRATRDTYLVLLLAQAGRQASLPGVPFPENALDVAFELLDGFGDREYALHTLCEPGSDYECNESHPDAPLGLMKAGGYRVAFADLPDEYRARVALRLWGGAVVWLAAHDARGGAEELRRANWWLTKAGMAWEAVRSPDWVSLRERAVARLFERFGEQRTDLDNQRAIFAHTVIAEVEAMQGLSMGSGPLVVSFPCDRLLGEQREVVALTPSLAAYAMAANRAQRTGCMLPTVTMHGADSGRMAAWVGLLLEREVRDLLDADLGFFPVFDSDVVRMLEGLDPDDNGVYPLQRKGDGR